MHEKKTHYDDGIGIKSNLLDKQSEFSSLSSQFPIGDK